MPMGGGGYKYCHGFRHLVLHYNPQMDSFNYIDPTQAQVQAGKERGGSGGNSYCVVAHITTVDAPTNMERGGSGGNSYCVVA